MKVITRILLVAVCCMFVLLTPAPAQDSTGLYDRMTSVPDKLFARIDKKSADVDALLAKQTDRYLSRLDKEEQRLKKKLMKKDPLLAMQLFGDVKERYGRLKTTSGKVGKYAQVYSGHLDSLRTGLKFLQTGKLSSVEGQSAHMEKALGRLNGLQDRLNQTDQIGKLLSQRERELKEQLGKLGMLKELKKYRQNVYYYQAQVKEYKAMFDNPDKLENTILSVVGKMPQFQGFFNRYSQMAGLFALPGSSNVGSAATGMQTSTSISQVLQERFGSNNAVVSQALQQSGGSAQASPLSLLRNKVSGYSSGSVGNNSNEGSMPDFKPNHQKTKSFLQRLELGTNLQSQKARSFFPVTSDLGLSVGYKLNDKSVIGIGGAYKMGLGSGWNKIRITHQGLGLRSFVDYKIKGAIYLSGGYEQNYRSGFSRIAQLKDYSGWQPSGLLGLSKRYAISKHMKGEMKLLWDFLSYRQVPKTQAVVFRLGYTLQ